MPTPEEYAESFRRRQEPDPRTIAHQNRLHGLLGRFARMDNDEKNAYAERGLRYHSELQPMNILQEDLVDLIHDNVWRIKHVVADEQIMFNEVDDGIPVEGKSLSRLNEYTAARERTLLQTVRTLEKVRGNPAPNSPPFDPYACEPWLRYERFIHPFNPRFHPDSEPQPQGNAASPDILNPPSPPSPEPPDSEPKPQGSDASPDILNPPSPPSPEPPDSEPKPHGSDASPDILNS
jgi:hypothetical protein